MDVFLAVLFGAIALIAVIALVRSVRIVPQQRMDVVERLGKYKRTLNPGLNILVPFIDSVRSKVDLREQVVSFPPQPVITSDSLVVSIDTVLYFKVVDAVRATYEIANFLQAIEQLTVTTLRNVIGSLDLEKALTSREEINRHLSGVLDETTGRWGVKVTRVEIKAIEPPPSIRDSMEKQMRAERDRRAAILTAEGVKLPQIANGSANKVWIVPTELTKAFEGIGGALGGLGNMVGDLPAASVDAGAVEREAAEAAEAAAAEAQRVNAEVRAAEA